MPFLTRCVCLLLLASLPSRGFSQTPKATAALPFVPALDGVVKVRSEWNLENGDFRMAVRNTRLGVRGWISPDLGYRLQMDLSNNGSFNILDAYILYKWNTTSFRLGQQHYQFSSDVMRGPSDGPFANRSFIGKYITNFANPINENFNSFDDFDLSNIGSRDVGVTIWQNFDIYQIPCTAILGIMNGAGANKAVWRNSPNYIGRLLIGGTKGFQGVVGTYVGQLDNGLFVEGSGLPERFDMLMWNLEARYTGKQWRIDAEMAVEHVDYHREIPDRINQSTVTGSIWSSYRIDQPWNRIHYWMPLARFDFGKALDFHNLLSGRQDRADAQRLTLGVNLGLHPVFNRTELRFQYEKFFFKEEPSDHTLNALFSDKFTIELNLLF